MNQMMIPTMFVLSSLAIPALVATSMTAAYAEPKANRTYYYFEWDYISPYTG